MAKKFIKIVLDSRRDKELYDYLESRKSIPMSSLVKMMMYDSITLKDKFFNSILNEDDNTEKTVSRKKQKRVGDIQLKSPNNKGRSLTPKEQKTKKPAFNDEKKAESNNEFEETIKTEIYPEIEPTKSESNNDTLDWNELIDNSFDNL